MFDNYMEDLRLAQLIVSNKYHESDDRNYNNTSTIYRSTNELISNKKYIEMLKNKKRILSVIASGDQIINSILLGSTDIVGYDISRFPKYYLYLKLAAIKGLEREEYLDFFVGNYDNQLLNVDTYDKIRVYLPDKCRIFWDSLFDYFDSCDINDSHLLCNEVFDRDKFSDRNYYLQDDNYNKTKLKIDKVNITLYNDNIFKLVLNNNIGKFNLINLSSIIHYPKDNFGSVELGFMKYRKFLDKLPLEDNGIALSYLYSIQLYWIKYGIINEYFNDKNIQLLPFSYIDEEDGLLVYKK